MVVAIAAAHRTEGCSRGSFSKEAAIGAEAASNCTGLEAGTGAGTRCLATRGPSTGAGTLAGVFPPTLPSQQARNLTSGFQ